MNAPTTNLPTMRTSFIGREQDISEVAHLLASSRLVTITGAAGCGKTRLALQVASGLSLENTETAHWVDLVPLSDPALLPQTVAKGLHVSEQPDRALLEGLVEVLQGQQLLLVLDNCEHLLEACAQFVKTLLDDTGVGVLATSREPLKVVGERLYPINPLSLPPPNVPAEDVDEIGRFESIRLFVERTRAILPTFDLSAENVAAVVKICRKLDGIPLAVELASARLKVLAAEQIAAQLEDHIDLLPAAAQLTQSHHHTLRAAIDWSYTLLSEREQVLFRRLSVFASGCSLSTAETVCAGDGIESEQVLELLASLVDKSLVVAETLHRGEARYALLETIRQYARDKLAASGEQLVLHDRHLGCYLNLTEEADSKIRGEYQQLWLNWLEGEYEEVRSALSWSMESGQFETGLRLCIALYQFWTIRDYVEEGLAWLERLLARPSEGIAPVLQANALAFAGFLAGFRGDIATQIEYGRAATAIAEAAGEQGMSALLWALSAQGYAARATGDYQTEFTISQRIIQLRRELGDPYLLGLTLSLYSIPAMALGKFDAARNMLEEGLPLLREAGDPYRIAMALNFLGDLERCEGNYPQALLAYQESEPLLRELEAERDLASVLHNLGHTCLRLGDVERARALFLESIASHEEQRNQPGIAECLLGFAALAIVRDRPKAGARLLAAADELGGKHVTSEWAATSREYEYYLARARASLTGRAFRAEQEAGRKLSLEGAMAYAHEVARKVQAAQKSNELLETLTPRERQVTELIAQAKSNGEIAEELVISKRTVETHVSNIRAKLGFTQRAQIVRWAIQTGLAKTGKTELPRM